MATAVLTNVPTAIDLAESTAGWSGDTFSLDPDIKVQGSNSVSCAMTNNGVNNIQASASFAVTNQHIRIWINLSFVTNISTEANNGIQIQVVSGSGTALYTVAGSDTYAGGWSQFVIYTGDTPTSGSLPSGTCTAVGLTVNTDSKPRNVPANCWVDAWYYGDGYTVTGGTSGDEIDWSFISDLDAVEAYGIVTRIDDIYFLAGDVTVGSGATTTFFKSGQKVQFKDLQVSSTLYGVTFAGSACNVEITGGAWGAAGTQDYLFDASDVNLNSFTLSGVQFSAANSILFGPLQNITNTVVSGCGQVETSTATLRSVTFLNTTSVDAALLWNDSNDVENCQFIDNTTGAAIEHPSSAGTPYTYVDLVFSGNTFDGLNTSGADIDVNLSGTSNAVNDEGANTITYIAGLKSFKFTLNPSITGYEWRIYTVTALGSLAGAVEITGQESASADNQTYSYSYSTDQPIAVQIISQPDEDYEEEVLYFTLVNANQDVTINLTPDGNNKDLDSIESLNPRLYLKPNSINSNSAADGSAITSWVDSSEFKQALTTGANPLLNLGSQGKEVEFRQSTDQFEIAHNTDLTFTGGTDEFSFVIREGDLGFRYTGGNPLFVFKGSTNNNYRLGLVSPNFRVQIGAGTPFLSNISTVEATNNKLYIVVVTTTEITLFIDGVQFNDSNSSTVDSATDNLVFRIGNIGSAPDASLDLVALIPKALTTAERQAIEAQFQIN